MKKTLQSLRLKIEAMPYHVLGITANPLERKIPSGVPNYVSKIEVIKVVDEAYEELLRDLEIQKETLTADEIMAKWASESSYNPITEELTPCPDSKDLKNTVRLFVVAIISFSIGALVMAWSLLS